MGVFINHHVFHATILHIGSNALFQNISSQFELTHLGNEWTNNPQQIENVRNRVSRMHHRGLHLANNIAAVFESRAEGLKLCRGSQSLTILHRPLLHM